MPALGSGVVGTLIYFEQRVRVTATGCMEWTGTLSDDGYGKAVVGYRGHGKPVRRLAHVAFYEMKVGLVADGRELDHLCRNRKCINPAHLEPITRKENVRRGTLPSLMRDPTFRPQRHVLTICKRGHEMIGDNVGCNAKRRWCRACRREDAKKARAK